MNDYPLFWDVKGEDDPGEKLDAELLKQKFQVASYLLTFVLLTFRARQFVSFFKREKTLLFMVAVLLLTAAASNYPDRVVINVVHLSLGLIATWLYFYDERRRKNIVYSACIVTIVSLMLTLGGSFLLFFALENSSFDAYVDGRRFSGISGNPNTLGGICIAGAWATFGLMSLTSIKSRRMFWLVIVLGIVVFDAWSTGSATTLTIIALMALMMVGFWVYGLFGKKGKAAVILGCTALIFGALFVLAVQQSADDYAFAATDAVGRDLTLTGRTELWQVGWDAFVQRPVLGWGYDNHQSVMETPSFGVPFNHYHNGYLDSLVSGGVLFGAAILLSYGAFFSRYRSFRTTISNGFPLIVAVAAVSIQNLTEYSLFRNNSTIWHIYIISFVAVAMITIQPRKRSKPAGTREPQQGSSTRRLRW